MVCWCVLSVSSVRNVPDVSTCCSYVRFGASAPPGYFACITLVLTSNYLVYLTLNKLRCTAPTPPPVSAFGSNPYLGFLAPNLTVGVGQKWGRAGFYILQEDPKVGRSAVDFFFPPFALTSPWAFTEPRIWTWLEHLARSDYLTKTKPAVQDSQSVSQPARTFLWTPQERRAPRGCRDYPSTDSLSRRASEIQQSRATGLQPLRVSDAHLYHLFV